MESTWTRTVFLAWEPTPRLYDRRSRLIEMLDDLMGVARFKVMNEGIRVVLASDTEVSVGLFGLTVYSLGKQAVSEDSAEIQGIAELVGKELQVSPTELRYGFQHILPWPEPQPSLAKAYQAAADRTVGEQFRRELRLTDLALLVDGHRESGGRYQAEFGVIDADQAPLRLSRVVGRSTGHKPSQHDLLLNLPYPAVGTFVDSTWWVTWTDGSWEAVVSRVREQLMQSEREADSLASALHERMTSLISTGGGSR